MNNYTVDFSSKIKQQAIDAVIFGPMSDDLEEKSRQESSILPYKSIEYLPFPLNSGEETASELNAIRLAQSTEPEWHTGEYKNKLDKDFLSIFTDYLDDLNLDYNKDYISHVLEDLGPTILQLKKMYNRPRPERLAQYHGIKIKVDPTSTAKTPAYPSGHSFQGRVIETILTKQHPIHKNIFRSISERISLARILRGLHFPSDVRFSNFIVDKYLSQKL